MFANGLFFFALFISKYLHNLKKINYIIILLLRNCMNDKEKERERKSKRENQ